MQNCFQYQPVSFPHSFTTSYTKRPTKRRALATCAWRQSNPQVVINRPIPYPTYYPKPWLFCFHPMAFSMKELYVCFSLWYEFCSDRLALDEPWHTVRKICRCEHLQAAHHGLTTTLSSDNNALRITGYGTNWYPCLISSSMWTWHVLRMYLFGVNLYAILKHGGHNAIWHY